MDFKEFKEFYYQYGKCLNDIQKRNKKLNESQLRSRYNKYCKQKEKEEERRKDYIEKQKEKQYPLQQQDEKWQVIKEKEFKRDNYQCQLLKKLNYSEKKIFEENTPKTQRENLDPAHILRKSQYPCYYYNTKNIITLNRASHNRLDHNQDPLTGRQISRNEVELWWKRIIGKSRKEFLSNLEEDLDRLNIIKFSDEN